MEKCKYAVSEHKKQWSKTRIIIRNAYKAGLRECAGTLCNYNGGEIIEGDMTPYHAHLLERIHANGSKNIAKKRN